MNKEKIIARIPRSATQELVVRTGEYWNIEIVDMRWYNNGSVSRKGLRVNMEEAKTLVKALEKIVGKYGSESEETEREV
tara:strand:- start:10015 stop:10251 length:237 start_codon:yes stop_codon:yes gene_type:complete